MKIRTSNADTYLPKLDGLRAISIAFVLVEHFLWNGHGLGGLGVTVFFVISGYLITSILLSYATKFSVSRAAAIFYWRRTLRLFPIYYLCIALTAAFNIGDMRKLWLISALYLMNVKVALDGAWNGASHFWSLAIEEQFYLLWFFVVVAMPRRFLIGVILFFIAVAPVFRGVVFSLTGNGFMGYLLPGVMDSLAIGALLAYAIKNPSLAGPWKFFQAIRMPTLLLSFCLIVVLQFRGDGDLITNIFLRSTVNLFAACLVAVGIDQAPDWRFDWLSTPILCHIGKISYGIYVYHNFVPELLSFHWFRWLPARHQFFVFAGVSVVIAEASWQLIEKPIMKLKDKVPLKMSSEREPVPSID